MSKSSQLKLANLQNKITCFVLATALVGMLGMTASAQVTTGITAFSPYQGSQFDTVSISNLNVLLTFPISKKTGLVPFSLSYSANSSISANSGHWIPNDQGFQSVSVLAGGLSSFRTRTTTCPGTNTQTTIFNLFSASDPAGGMHIFPGAVDSQGCINGHTSTSATGDGSGYTLVVNANVGGITSSYLYDRSGNKLSGGPSGFGPYTDTNGNQVSWDSNTGNYLGGGGTGTILTQNVSNPASKTYSYPDASGNQQVTTVTSASRAWKTAFGCPSVADVTGTSVYFPTQITYPQSLSVSNITFQPTPGTPADTTGRIQSYTLPTGGVISFGYSGGTNGINCIDGTAATLTRTGPDGMWQYVHVPGASPNTLATTTVTDPAGNKTVYTFGGTSLTYSGPYEVQRQIYQGSSTLLKTLVTCYNGNLTNCAAATSVGGSTNPIQRRTVFTQIPNAAGKQSETDTFYNSLGSPTEIDEYDFGAGAVGPLLRKTLITYGSWNGTSCEVLGNNINDRVCEVLVQDGSGNKKGDTLFSYDQSTAIALTGTPYHVSVTGSRGNLEKVQKWVSGTSYLTSTLTHYDTGVAASFTDVNGAISSTTFSDATSTCGNAFPSSTSAGSLSTSYQWNCNLNKLTQETDPNGAITTYSYADPLGRLTSTTDPASAITTICYGIISGGVCTSNSTQIEKVLSFNSGNSAADTLTTLDSLGRASLAQTRQAPGSSNFDTVYTQYDSDGRTRLVTPPCVKTAGQACATTPATTTTYDGLNRPLLISDSGGGTVAYTYNANDVLQTIGPAPTGENTKRRQMQYDGLGRLSSVCEITSLTGSGSCSQSTAATGFLTSYNYNALDNLSGVTQNAQGSPVQTRTFTYDGVSRMTSEANPESINIATTYTYDSDSAGTCTGTYNGDLVKKTDPAGNVTCSKFDSLHRITGNTYPSGPNSGSTPTQTFVYDATTFSCPTGSNVKGRLAEAYTGVSPKITDIGLCYSPRGETTDVWESTPNSAGLYRTAASYWENGIVHTLAGYLASGSTFVPTETYTPDGEGRWKSVGAASGPNPISTTAYNAASKITGITYGSTDSDSFTYDNALRMNNYTFSLNGSSEISVPTWNSNGTLRTLAITQDPFNAGNVQTCTYGYDDLARVTSANCGTPWAQTFSYDPFGNLTKSSGSVMWQPGYNQSTNRYTLAGTTYDANGNLTNDSFHAYAWDSNGRPVSLGGKTMTYDALGRVVEKLDAGVYSQFVYSPSGSLFARMSGQSATSVRVPLPGSWAVYGSSSSFNHYEHLDWLGNSRLSSNQSRQMTSDIAYAPFGEPYASSATSGVSFTGMRSDVIGVSGGITNGLYDFIARELPPTQGRWLSPDPAGAAAADPANPQTWNRYAYVANNPLTFTDPMGLLRTGGDGFADGSWDAGCGWAGFNDFGPDFCGGEDLLLLASALPHSRLGCADGDTPGCFYSFNHVLPGEQSLPSAIGTGNPVADAWDALGLPRLPCQAQYGPWCDPSMLPNPWILDATPGEKNQACLDKINSTPDGKFYNFFSAASPWFAPDTLAWDTSRAAVAGTVGILKLGANNLKGLPLGKVMGATADASIWGAKKYLPLLVIPATFGQATVHLGCRIASGNF